MDLRNQKVNLGRGLVSALVLGPAFAGCEATEDPEPDPVVYEPMAGEIDTWAGVGEAGLSPEGARRQEMYLYLPQDLTFGPDGLPYLLDWNNHRVVRFNQDDTTTVVAGSGEVGDGPDGPALLSRLNHPTNLAFDDRYLYISAWHNAKIKQVDLTTSTLIDFCGTGDRTYGGDGGPCIEAKLDLPSSLMFDSVGDLVVSDQANQRIRKIDMETMLINTIVGTGQTTPVAGSTGDGGPAMTATLYNPVGQSAPPAGRMMLDADDNIYIADSGNHCIRKVTAADGIINTIAGNHTAGYSGDGGNALQAQLFFPTDLHVTADGRIFVADMSNNCVRMIDSQGIISTVAGMCGTAGYGGDQGPATEALLNQPYGVVETPDGNLLIGDSYNHRVRIVYF